jgi:hypothetical protein
LAKSTGRRGYNAYLRKAKRRFGITHAQARKMYKLQVIKAGGPVNSRELDKHPIVSKRLAAAASKPERRTPSKKTTKPTVSQPRKPGGTRPGGATASGKRGAEAAPKRATTIRQWEQYYDEADYYEDMTVEAGVDTGKGKK